MILSSLRTNQISDDALSWYGKYLEALDQRDMTALMAMVADECTLQINNNMPSYGKAAIEADTSAYFAGFKSTQHEPLAILGNDQEFAVELLLHYTRLRGDVFSIPCVSIKSRNAAGLLTSVRIFADTSPLAA